MPFQGRGAASLACWDLNLSSVVSLAFLRLCPCLCSRLPVAMFTDSRSCFVRVGIAAQRRESKRYARNTLFAEVQETTVFFKARHRHFVV